MTHAPTHDVRGPGAILSRLLVVLALVLFGAPQSHADGVANAGPAAQSKVAQADCILAEKRHLLRAQLPDDASPDMMVPGASNQARPACFTASISPAPQPLLSPVAIRILPPVRAPPAA